MRKCILLTTIFTVAVALLSCALSQRMITFKSSTSGEVLWEIVVPPEIEDFTQCEITGVSGVGNDSYNPTHVFILYTCDNANYALLLKISNETVDAILKFDKKTEEMSFFIVVDGKASSATQSKFEKHVGFATEV